MSRGNSRGSLNGDQPKVVMGVDPGLARTGWGVIQKIQNEKFKMKNYSEGYRAVGYGVIETRAGVAKKDRLKQIYDELRELMQKYQPDLVAIEKVFFGKNAKTAMMVGEARGVTTLAAVQLGRPIREFTPLQVKMAMSGYGRADKQQIQRMIKRLLNLPRMPKSDDAADALAVGLTACATKSYDR